MNEGRTGFSGTTTTGRAFGTIVFVAFVSGRTSTHTHTRTSDMNDMM